MVVGMSDIQIGMESVNPSKSAGLKIGDILLSINGREITRNDDIKNSILNSSGEQLHIQGTRAGNAMDFYLQP
jgi:stage IV sporulation protein B